MTINYGIMGGASIVPRFVAGLQASASSQAAAIATRHLDKTKKMASDLGIPKVHETYEALVADPELDIIYIPLWNKGHFEGAKLAIENGKHVLLEKRFTLKAADAATLFDLAKAKGVFLMEAQKAVFLPVMQEIKHRLEAGEIGRVEWVDIQQSHPGVEVIPWFDDVTVGGGAYIGSASYPLSVLQYLFGAGFDTANGRLLHESGKSDHIGQVMLTKGHVMMSSLIATSFQLNSRLVIHGQKGVVTIPDYWKATSAEVIVNGQVTQLDLPHDSEFVFEIAHIEACIAAGRLTSPIMTPEITLVTGQLVEALYQQTFN